MWSLNGTKRFLLPLLVAAVGDARTIEIYGQSPTPQRWQLVPELTIGGAANADHALTAVQGVAVDSDGTLFVLQHQEQTIKVFDRAGRSIGRIGRRGSGPGEFVFPLRLGLHGDTLWVTDRNTPRVTFFTKEGTVLSTISPSIYEIYRGARASPTDVLANGTLLSRPLLPADLVTLGQVQSVPLLRLKSDGTLLDSIARLSVRNSVFRFQSHGASRPSTAQGPQPISPEDLYAVAPDGASLLVVEQQVPKASTSTFRVTKISVNGDTLWSRAYRFKASRLSPQVADSIVDHYARLAARSMISDVHRARMVIRTALFLPDYLPPITGIAVASTGTIWLRREQHTGQRQVAYTVLQDTGDILATTSLHPRGRILAATETHAWAVEKDDYDVSSVVRYRISK